MSSYDSWKLSGPPEGLECPKCGDQIDEDGKCSEECNVRCCWPDKCWCEDPRV